MSIRETQQKLEQWGMWAEHGVRTGYSSTILATMRGSSLPSATITDEYAGRIDRVVAILKRTNREQYLCIKMVYRKKMANRAIGRELGISGATVQRRIAQAENWLDMAFDAENV